MKRGELEAVVKNCPNAKFELSCPGIDCLTYCQVVGERLQKVWFDDCLKSITEPSDFAEMWDSCHNIRDIDAGLLEPSEFQAAFKKPKQSLETISLAFGNYKALCGTEHHFRVKGTEQ